MDTSKEETIEATLRQRIRKERAREQALTPHDVYRCISNGELVRATGNLLFHTAPPALDEKLKTVLDRVRQAYVSGDIGLQTHILDFLVQLAIGFRSFLPNWVILRQLEIAEVVEMSENVSNVLMKLTRDGGEAYMQIAANQHKQTIARLKAEGISNESEAKAMADRLMGNSLVDYVSNIARELQSSNLMEVSCARLRGETHTQLGNDYAAFLQYAIWLGASFVTTNPVLIKLAWDIDPEFWNKRVDDLILSKYTPDELNNLLQGPDRKLDTAITTISSIVTMAVVEENCRLLRDIFLITDGREGYVSLQVNPKSYNECEQMVTEAKHLHAYLKDCLGGVPNVVFKLPATAAGKSAAQKLTSEGIGVTITVEFSVFQALGFAEVLRKGKMLVAYLALMNGRIAYPVRDEMKEKDIEGGVEAACWAGVEVARKAYRRLYGPPEKGGMGIDPERIRLLAASLRIYDDWIPDISELWDCPVITVFPDVRRKFDSQKRDFVNKAILKATPAKEMEVLRNSEIFRQAWWMTGDPEEHKPKTVLSLEQKDSEALTKWPPLANTLGQFIDLYEETAEMVKERIKYLTASNKE